MNAEFFALAVTAALILGAYLTVSALVRLA